jgi:hypothetical protein
MGTIKLRYISETYTQQALARICAELTRQGIAFNVEQLGDEFVIHLTGY